MEPSVVSTFMHAGFRCEVRRNPHLGTLCGYMDIPPCHPWYGLDYGAIHERHPQLDVHGGLTYADKNDDYWRIGFDCAHAGDLIPGFETNFPGETYRDQTYVERELRLLAEYAADLTR